MASSCRARARAPRSAASRRRMSRSCTRRGSSSSSPPSTWPLPPALLEELSDTLEQQAFYLGRDTMKDLTTALAFDRAFHQKLVEARDNAVIAGWHRRILAQTHTAYVYLANDTSRVYGEHR